MAFQGIAPLAYCVKILKQMCGTIEMESIKEMGTKFTIVLIA
jgi:C4-dicarboxylate-specific signal transduction histidine kinase